jgi:hypothetical protein
MRVPAQGEAEEEAETDLDSAATRRRPGWAADPALVAAAVHQVAADAPAAAAQVAPAAQPVEVVEAAEVRVCLAAAPCGWQQADSAVEAAGDQGEPVGQVPRALPASPGPASCPAAEAASEAPAPAAPAAQAEASPARPGSPVTPVRGGWRRCPWALAAPVPEAARVAPAVPEPEEVAGLARASAPAREPARSALVRALQGPTSPLSL